MANKPPQWYIYGATVQGAAHQRSRIPNQDALYWQPQKGYGPKLSVALADGHGNAKHLRSHVGASLAVQTATNVLKSNMKRTKQ